VRKGERKRATDSKYNMLKEDNFRRLRYTIRSVRAASVVEQTIEEDEENEISQSYDAKYSSYMHTPAESE
jgi:lipoate-protein ligase A